MCRKRGRMTNQEHLADLCPSDCYDVMCGLLGEYSGFCEAAAKKIFVMEWLKSEAVVGEWQRVHGYMTAGGDPVFRCSCGHSEHVFGIEHPLRKPFCEHCGCFNLYPAR